MGWRHNFRGPERGRERERERERHRERDLSRFCNGSRATMFNA
jgi:hypothetical protein